MRERLKKWVFGLLGKDPEAVVVSFGSGPDGLVGRMFDEIRELAPDRRHILIRPADFADSRAIRKYLKPYRIGLAPVLFTGEPEFRWMRRAALLLRPDKILAYNQRLERHHLALGTWLASWLFLRGVPLDRIFLRPRWLVPWKKDRSRQPRAYQEHTGRPFSPERKRIGILTPYFPYPLSHGGAVRIYSLIREIASTFDVILFSFGDRNLMVAGPLLEHCSKIFVVDQPRYREPRWSTLVPPEVAEFNAPLMKQLIERCISELRIDVLQVEYTALAPYAGDILVEHDVTFSLYRQIFERERTLGAWWNYWRWLRFERRWIARYRRVIAMSDEDQRLLTHQPNVAQALLRAMSRLISTPIPPRKASSVEKSLDARRKSACATVIPNGVDLDRFWPEHERPGERLLFIGSFRHFPNIVAFQFFLEQVWPLVRAQSKHVRLTVVAGPDPLLYWRDHTGLEQIQEDPRVEILAFVADVRPLYIEANLVLAPTLVSAGTNLKVIEALAMDRAVVSTTSGCAGLGLRHGETVWIADRPEEFALAVRTLLKDRELRQTIARGGRRHAELNFNWKHIGARQRTLLRKMIPTVTRLRQAVPGDLDRIAAIQATSPESSQWHREDYLSFDCTVAEAGGEVAAFLVSRQTCPAEREILNIAVDPEYRRLGLAKKLIRRELTLWAGEHFLEVRRSNLAARRLYESFGFREVGVRPGYYENPAEPGIVMRFFS